MDCVTSPMSCLHLCKGGGMEKVHRWSAEAMHARPLTGIYMPEELKSRIFEGIVCVCPGARCEP